MLEHTTVFAVQGSLFFLLSGVILFAFRGRPSPSNSGHYWLAAGYLFSGLGLQVLAMEHVWSQPVITVVGNALLLIFGPLTARGLAKLTGQRSQLDWYLLALTFVTLADFSFFTYWRPSWLLLSWQSGVLTAVQYGSLIALLRRSKEREIQPAIRAVVILFAMHIVVHTIRLVVWHYTRTALWFSGMNVISIVGIALSYCWMHSLRMQTQLQQSARTDPLTGLYNRRAIADVCEEALRHACRMGSPCSALMVDLERFKEINDALGHAAGDASLRAVAGVLKQVARRHDIAVRVGGDEFLLLLPDADEYAVRAIAQSIHAAIHQLRLRASNGTVYRVMVTLGCATLRGEAVSSAALMHAADLALYEERQARQHRTA